MKRKALLVSMAVVAGLPGGALAKGVGKLERPGSAYAGYGAGQMYLRAADGLSLDPTVAREEDRASALARLKVLLGKVTWAAGGELAGDGRGWKMEMLQPQVDVRLSDGGDPRVKPRDPLGFVLRYTF